MFCTFGVFPHDFRRRVTLHGAVENSSFAVDAVLVVGLHHKPWRHWGKKKLLASIAGPQECFVTFPIPVSSVYQCPLTSNNQLPLPADSGSGVAGDARVVSIVLQRHLGDLQGAHELFGFDPDTRGRARHDELAVFVPGDANGHVPG